jgi:hypothetical protein
MIPKKIHFYWGNDKISFLRYMTLKSFRYFNPEWEINLVINDKASKDYMKWTTLESQDKIGYIGGDYFEKIHDLRVNIKPLDYNLFINDIDPEMSDVHISDFLGWWLLWKEGGIVADMDILFTKQVSQLIATLNRQKCNSAMAMFSKFENYMPVSFMVGDGKDNQFYKDIFSRAKNNYNPAIYQSAGSNSVPFKSLDNIHQTYRQLVFMPLSEYIVFPFHNQLDACWSEWCFTGNYVDNMEGNHIGIHWYAGTPLSQIWNNKINENNYAQYNNTICNLIKKINKD